MGRANQLIVLSSAFSAIAIAIQAIIGATNATRPAPMFCTNFFKCLRADSTKNK